MKRARKIYFRGIANSLLTSKGCAGSPQRSDNNQASDTAKACTGKSLDEETDTDPADEVTTVSSLFFISHAPLRTACTVRKLCTALGCSTHQFENLRLAKVQRQVDLSAQFEPTKGIPNRSFVATALSQDSVPGAIGCPAIKKPILEALLESLLVSVLFLDVKRHDPAPNFYERNRNGSPQPQLFTGLFWETANTVSSAMMGKASSERKPPFGIMQRTKMRTGVLQTLRTMTGRTHLTP